MTIVKYGRLFLQERDTAPYMPCGAGLVNDLMILTLRGAIAVYKDLREGLMPSLIFPELQE
jgi:hypothetical protein